MLTDDFELREVEQDIYSVLPTDETGNEYDSQFGFFYDLIACNPIYNRLIWGYSTTIFHNVAQNALQSATEGPVLDLACGSLAFTYKLYSQYNERPIILLDQSLKMLKMAKSRLIKLNKDVPNNLVFLHSNALNLPFKKDAISTVISENLLHCLSDTSPLLDSLKKITTDSGKLYFTTLVKCNRWADTYLQGLSDNGKLISRTINDHKEYFIKAGLNATYKTQGSLLLVECRK